MLWVEEKSVLDDRKARLPQRVANYKEMHKEKAAAKGIIKEFMAAKTLTELRRLLFGSKK